MDNQEKENIKNGFINKSLFVYLENIEFDYSGKEYEKYIEKAQDTGRTGPRLEVSICAKGDMLETEEFYYNSYDEVAQDISHASSYYSFD
jgi:hypothetical protein